MGILEILGIVIAGAIVGWSLLMWGLVNTFDVLDARAIRRAEKKRKLQEAKKYMKDPEAYVSQENPRRTASSTTWIGVSPSNTMTTNE